ncbi:hypothetical protein DAPPUDRAFT_118154 [Daphnia pulex]|uniref:Uncharacterized protein n=1 Tax=Daphnia pulex TaxID=6669 RepID=E9HUW4_DAPPU|nr:hypothetical protein DAPPUDRAFT_118154 [Daphnia pulex]|eukprot:EFX64460.1 hypothetical protein DAPPUDRAFT_118154 [Daphnia pulex]
MTSQRSDSDSESSNESVDRRVEFEDGWVVYLPNNMPGQRIRELRQNQLDLAFYHRYNAGDICLGPREDHWEALGRRSENAKLFIIRSPLKWNVKDQDHHHFHYEPVSAIVREEERREEYEGYGSPFVRGREEQIKNINDGDDWGNEPGAWAIAPRRSPVDRTQKSGICIGNHRQRLSLSKKYNRFLIGFKCRPLQSERVACGRLGARRERKSSERMDLYTTIVKTKKEKRHCIMHP